MDGASMLAFSRADIRTPKARGYLIQLCRHFGHKIPATYADNRGRIEFNAGVCELEAGDTDVLKITVSTADPGQLATLEDVVERHLRRFALKEELAVSWVGS